MIKKLHIVIGRFEPPHLSHIEFLRQAAIGADDLLVILGSSYQAPSSKNPFSWGDRVHMIGSCFEEKRLGANLWFRPVRDSRYDDQEWRSAVLKTVEAFCREHHPDDTVEVTLYGVSKPSDTTTWYLDYFPMWKYFGINPDTIQAMNATSIRSSMFLVGDLSYCSNVLHPAVQDFLTRWVKSEDGIRLAKEYAEILREKKLASAYPYPLTYTTSDAVVIWRNKILLVRRGGLIGNGLWALPGGFIGADNETCYNAAKREAAEETGCELRDEWCLTPDGMVFDCPTRSLRGRTISHGYLFQIPDDVTPGVITGMDDAAYACWYPFGEIPGIEHMLFEDHIDIIRRLTQRAGIKQPNWRPEL